MLADGIKAINKIYKDCGVENLTNDEFFAAVGVYEVLLDILNEVANISKSRTGQ